MLESTLVALYSWSRASVFPCSACLSASCHLCNVAELELWPWEGTPTHTLPHIKQPSHLGPISIGCQQSQLHLLASLRTSSLLFCLLPVSLLLSSPRVLCCEDSRETEPRFPSYFPEKPKWKDTTNLFSLLPHGSPQMLTRDCSTVSDLLLDSKNTHAAQSYYWPCLWISRVCGGVEEFNDTQCHFNFITPWPGYPGAPFVLYSREEGDGWGGGGSLKPVWLPVCKGMKEWGESAFHYLRRCEWV